MKYLIIGFLVLLTPMIAQAEGNTTTATGTIIVNVAKIKSAKGNIKATLFKNEKGFPRNLEYGFGRVNATIQNGKAVIRFENIPFGAYAVSVFHDENSNAIVDSSFFGMPKEGVGCSRGALGFFGPPQYNEAMFVLDQKKKEITITLKYRLEMVFGRLLKKGYLFFR